mmetsp:Transcript_21204/g.47090  ORF Transcript_21204/g.47090 Transcript_21204/m.47090 type:complete len:145 (-) Transcript_21204:226-660(-)
MSFRSHQSAYRAQHTGQGSPYNTHAAHYLSVDELQHFGVSQRNYLDGDHNYRMAQQWTNQSQHKRMDNMMMEAHRSRQSGMDGFSCKRNGGQINVSRQDLVDRLSHKIDSAKASGAIDNPRMLNYLKSTAERLNMDRRVFNGYK